MSLHKSLDSNLFSYAPDEKPSQDVIQNWRVGFPNPADFNFDFHKLLSQAKDTGIARARNPELRIAIVGAGAAGLTAARELFRCGYHQIDIFEASDRLTGRLYSRPVKGQYTTFEMGAMRIPFFDTGTELASAMGYYVKEFELTYQPFPDPGGDVADTGIYINDGLGPDPLVSSGRPELLIWKAGAPEPPTDILKIVNKKWSDFASLVLSKVKPVYGTQKWDGFWQQIVSHYWQMNFRELVFLNSIDHYDEKNPGYFGGLGMNAKEAEIFYTIGAGDGSWGAFYDISCLYPMRTLLFGFATKHKLIQGRFNKEGVFVGGVHHAHAFKDSNGKEIPAPTYLGVQSVAECLFYLPVNYHSCEKPISLYDALKEKHQRGLHLFTSSPVSKVEKQADDRIKVTSSTHEGIYDAVILTAPTWAMELSTTFSGFPQTQLPFTVINSMKSSHWITSCKVFIALKKRYWEDTPGKGKKVIPQLISTDTPLQGIYGYALDTASIKDSGVVLLSYTWEDDANKLLADQNDKELVSYCLRELDTLLVRCGYPPMSDYVDHAQTAVIHWSHQPTARGCAKLYRQRTWDENHSLLTYNQNHSHESNLYFAGEAFSLEGGWTEPALRLGIDATLHLLHKDHAEFLHDFNFERDYPKYPNWQPPSKT